MADVTEPRRQTGIRRVVVVVPSFFTLANLFFGFWAIVMAFNGNFRWAGFFIVFAGILDMVDGRIARLSNTGTKFGAELDSLVDVVSFGVAPALLMYFLEFTTAGKFGWVVCYLYVVATALRLARYNVMSHGAPSSWFTGIPSPAAGMTLATFFLFTETAWYQTTFADRDAQHIGVTVLILLLAALMVSNIKYPRWPRIGVRTWSGIAGLLVHIVIIGGAILAPGSFLFLLGIFYMLGGIVRHMVLNLLERGQPAELPAAAGDHSSVDRVPEEER